MWGHARLPAKRGSNGWCEHRLRGRTYCGLSIPAAQILGPGRVVLGLAKVLGLIGDPELAWMFLTQDWSFADEAARPLDKLLAGRTKEVIDAAPGFGTTFT